MVYDPSPLRHSRDCRRQTGSDFFLPIFHAFVPVSWSRIRVCQQAVIVLAFDACSAASSSPGAIGLSTYVAKLGLPSGCRGREKGATARQCQISAQHCRTRWPCPPHLVKAVGQKAALGAGGHAETAKRRAHVFKSRQRVGIQESQPSLRRRLIHAGTCQQDVPASPTAAPLPGILLAVEQHGFCFMRRT